MIKQLPRPEEMRAAGLPWDEGVHDAILTDTLGTRPVAGGVPSRMLELGDRVRELLGDASLHLDSQQKLLRALHRVGTNPQNFAVKTAVTGRIIGR